MSPQFESIGRNPRHQTIMTGILRQAPCVYYKNERYII